MKIEFTDSEKNKDKIESDLGMLTTFEGNTRFFVDNEDIKVEFEDFVFLAETAVSSVYSGMISMMKHKEEFSDEDYLSFISCVIKACMIRRVEEKHQEELSDEEFSKEYDKIKNEFDDILENSILDSTNNNSQSDKVAIDLIELIKQAKNDLNDLNDLNDKE